MDRIPHMVQQQPVLRKQGVQQQIQEHQSFEYVHGCPKGMQANPTEGFQGGDDAGTETAHAHSSRI